MANDKLCELRNQLPTTLAKGMLFDEQTGHFCILGWMCHVATGIEGRLLADLSFPSDSQLIREELPETVQAAFLMGENDLEDVIARYYDLRYEDLRDLMHTNDNAQYDDVRWTTVRAKLDELCNEGGSDDDAM